MGSTTFFPPPPTTTPGPNPGGDNYVRFGVVSLQQAQALTPDAHTEYDITSPPSAATNPYNGPKWNDDPNEQTVRVAGLPGGSWSDRGYLVTAGRAQPVTVDVAAGTYQVGLFLVATPTGLARYDNLKEAAAAGGVYLARSVVVADVAREVSELTIFSAYGFYQNDLSTQLGISGSLRVFATRLGYVFLSQSSALIQNGRLDTLRLQNGNSTVELFASSIGSLEVVGGSTATIILYPGSPDLPTPLPAGVTVLDRRTGSGGNSLDFDFDAGSADTRGFTLSAAYATTYTAQTSANVASATLDGNPLTLPVTLAAGTTYTLAITRTDPAAGATLTLSA